MLYDLRLALNYSYEGSVRGDRHLIRVQPATIPGVQRVIASTLNLDPDPQQRSAHTDFFGNAVTTIAYAGRHSHLHVQLSARVSLEDTVPAADLSPPREQLRAQISRLWSIGAESPHHFLKASTRIPADPGIGAYAADVVAACGTVQEDAMALCLAIHQDFAYDTEATLVDTSPSEAFALRRGVCQDFAHVMIAGLRALGIPAAYVSGFLRTIPPPGKPRLEGADAMHAWVRVRCDEDAGWIGVDPTNVMLAGSVHNTIGHGRDYSDVTPIVGVLRSSSGNHENSQSVDVVRVA